VRDAWSSPSDAEKDLLVHLLAKVRLNLLTAMGDADEARQVEGGPDVAGDKA
jgi:hypothetical protein